MSDTEDDEDSGPWQAVKAILVVLIIAGRIYANELNSDDDGIDPTTRHGLIGIGTGEAEELNQYDSQFLEASAAYEVPANLLKAVAWAHADQTAGEGPDPVNILPIERWRWETRASEEGFDLDDPRGNILMGALLLGLSLQSSRSYDEAIRAYYQEAVAPRSDATADRFRSRVRSRWELLETMPSVALVSNAGDRSEPSLYGADPYRARDGSLKTNWSAPVPNMYFEPATSDLKVDLGRTVIVSSVWWIFGKPQKVDSYSIYVSTNGKSWRIVERQDETTVDDWNMAVVEGEVRYLRISFLNPRTGPTIGHVAELEVFESLDVLQPATPIPLGSPEASIQS